MLLEAGERQVAGTRVLDQLGDGVGDGRRRLGVSIGAQDEQRGVDAGQADRFEDCQAREVGPLAGRRRR